MDINQHEFNRTKKPTAAQLKAWFKKLKEYETTLHNWDIRLQEWEDGLDNRESLLDCRDDQLQDSDEEESDAAVKELDDATIEPFHVTYACIEKAIRADEDCAVDIQPTPSEMDEIFTAGVEKEINWLDKLYALPDRRRKKKK